MLVQLRCITSFTPLFRKSPQALDVVLEKLFLSIVFTPPYLEEAVAVQKQREQQDQHRQQQQPPPPPPDAEDTSALHSRLNAAGPTVLAARRQAGTSLVKLCSAIPRIIVPCLQPMCGRVMQLTQSHTLLDGEVGACVCVYVRVCARV